MMVDYAWIKKIAGKQNLAIVLAGSFGALAIVRELGKNGVPTVVLGNPEYIGKSRYGIDLKIRHSQEIVQFLKELPHHLPSKPVLFTDNEEHLQLLYENWDTLSAYYLAPLHRNNGRITDKTELYRNALKAGIKAPKTYTGDAQANIQQFPVLIKPINDDKLWQQSGMKYQKVYECHNREELQHTLQLLKRYEADSVAQQIIPGSVKNLYCITLYRNSRGKVVIGFVVNKLSQYPIEYGTGVIHATCIQEELIAYSVCLLECVNYIGVAMIEFKYDQKKKEFYIIEVNGRFPVETGIIHKLGNRFVYHVYRDLINPSEVAQPYELPSEPVVWIYFLSYLRMIRQKGIDWFQDLWRFYGKYRMQEALLQWSDPLPALYFPKYLFRRMLRRE